MNPLVKQMTKEWTAQYNILVDLQAELNNGNYNRKSIYAILDGKLDGLKLLIDTYEEK